MPVLGEIQVGKNSKKYIWAACERCGRERWVGYCVGIGHPRNHICNYCSRNSSRKKQTKRHFSSLGYILVSLPKDSPYLLMVSQAKMVLEHRLVMAQYLGRCLLKSEVVHHKNGIRSDNRLENLELISRSNHALYNSLCSKCELRKEIRLLRWQLKEVLGQAKLKI